ncbi:hypothetical protein VNO77_20078 [Canavalia gladiata]|uniref:Uncharacterized protein n=1 Tax=Canavalia gladiata TaxID=3824 RepID=A0AAN9LTV5_CANGL
MVSDFALVITKFVLLYEGVHWKKGEWVREWNVLEVGVWVCGVGVGVGGKGGRWKKEKGEGERNIMKEEE